MADPGVVYTGFDPAFGDKLNQLIALAKARGYSPQLISGRRDAYGWPGMKGQSQADLYSQLGKPGGPKAAAPPGYSPHQYGVAGDVAGLPQSVLEQLASEVGLRAIHSDPNHLELPNWQQTAATQPPMTAWDQSNPANVPSQYAMNMEAGGPGAPSRPATGAATVKPDLLTALQHYESGGQNIPNVHQGTSSGQAQGYNQITTGTWNEFGGQQYAPDPLHATSDQQNAIAAKIPLRRWDPKTLDYLRGQGFTLDPNKTLAENIAANHGVTPTTPGTTLNSAPTTPAGGPAAPAVPGQPAYAPGSAAAKLQALGKAGQGLEKAAGADSGGDQPPDFKLAPIQPAQPVGGAMMMGAGGQNTFAQRAAQQGLAQQGFMLQPSLAAFGAYNPPSPIGAPSPAGATPGSAQGMPAMPGTTLNSPSALQMALMSGSINPYDLYARAGMGAGGFGST